jgi:subtilisin family serine protease
MPRRLTIAAALAVSTVALLTAPAALPAKEPPPGHPTAGKTPFGPGVVPGEVIVRFKEGTSSSERLEARGLTGARFGRSLLLARTQVVKVDVGEEREAAARLEQDPNVAYAEPNLVVYGDVTPNDTRFSNLWGLHNTAQAVNGVTGLADADIDAPEAWNMGKGLGSSVRVAVVDSGVAASHPDLAANMFVNPGESGGGKETNGIDDDANGKIDDFRGWDFVNNDNNPADDHSHGTHVSGTVAARSNNNLGVSGAASFPTGSGNWAGPTIIAIKSLNSSNAGSTASVADGLVYAGTMGAKVANASLGAAGTSMTFDNAIKSRPATLYVTSAGNDGVNNDTTPHTPCVPATLPDAANKICVAATDSSDQLASFSNFGSTNVDLAAPGVSILSTLPTGTLFFDNFETDIAGRWITNDAGQTGAPRWNRTNLFSFSPTNSITDSPGGTAAAPAQYVNNQDNWARNATGINLTGGTDCSIRGVAMLDTELNFDFFTVEVTHTPAVPASWQEVFVFSGAATGLLAIDLPASFDNTNGVFVRFRMNADGNITDDGAYVDDVRVQCFGTGFDANSYGFFNGSSMAAPHVTGGAAYLFTKYLGASVAQTKDRILRSADKKPQLSGKVGTGARLNLYKATAESTAGVSGGRLRFVAGTGQKNNVTVTRFTDTDSVLKYRITDPYSTATGSDQTGSRIAPGAGCTRVNDTTVKCPVAGINRIVLTGGDLDDTLNAPTIGIPLTIDGGAGLDRLTGGTVADTLIGGANPDRFTGGTGNDTINARNEDVDTQFNCGENTGDIDTVNADLAPNDPVTASAGNCEVVSKL